MTTTTLDPAVAEMLEHFEFAHLPLDLQEVSRPFRALAYEMTMRGAGEELTAGLRKLLESKDCMVRAARVRRRLEAEAAAPKRPAALCECGHDVAAHAQAPDGCLVCHFCCKPCWSPLTGAMR